MTVSLIQSDVADVGQRGRPQLVDVPPHLILIDDAHYAKIWLRDSNKFGESFWCIKVLGGDFDDNWLDVEYDEDWSGYVGHEDDPMDRTLEHIELTCRNHNLI